jgi:hypothetical protein
MYIFIYILFELSSPPYCTRSRIIGILFNIIAISNGHQSYSLYLFDMREWKFDLFIYNILKIHFTKLNGCVEMVSVSEKDWFLMGRMLKCQHIPLKTGNRFSQSPFSEKYIYI